MCTAQAAQQGIHLKKNVTTARYLSMNILQRKKAENRRDSKSKPLDHEACALKTAQDNIPSTITKTSNALGEDVCWQHQLRKKL